ncbi:Alpha/Beta hydrolase protein [Ephemerocybe angulata]|uniref:Alpha/Beta hydrolase protein n=1 Tax=Ephemerocybe angulata TaxID=980116 RepID=A0A8H6HZ78_9AGAR|nr:Alpha/Beta hydrolase protein [Tulosesus angulatus]
MSTDSEASFTINIAQGEIEFLRKKLELTRLPDEITDAGRDYGVPLTDIRRLLARWKDGYDWKKHEAILNAELPQFTRKVAVDGFDELDIHYVHKKSKIKDALPLLFVHGWPGSFTEVRKILPLLTAPSDEYPSFHVVTFSLPGYGFSSNPTKRGFGMDQYAEVGHKLMLALGYHEYVTQGGDWGFYILRRQASLYGGTHNKAWHTNFPRALPDVEPPSSLPNPYDGLTEVERNGLERTKWFRSEGRGYAIEQGTQPQTLGYSLADSPVGLLGWIYEKLVNWSDEYPWEEDEVLTWVSIYWFSRAGPTASLRIYYERMHEGSSPEETHIPMGYSYFPKELWRVPSRWLQAPNLVFESEHTEGGHFAAHEKPELLVGDLRTMFGKGGPAFGVVPGKSGYNAEVRHPPS